jgi:D-alanyl-lipoteichoic acid acyltransferase DltB (MBOAT superfamily)
MPVVDGMQPNLGLMSPLLAIPVVLLAYWATLRRLRLNNLVLLVAGFWLYAWGSPVGGLLLFILTLFNYYLAKYLPSSAQYRQVALGFGLAVNILVWIVCRNESGQNAFLMAAAGFAPGMSFYMLRNVSYLVEQYRGEFHQPPDFVEYALYVSFYPQIFSGPIEKPTLFIEQIRKPRLVNWRWIGNAFPLILLGLFKKITIADNLGIIVERIFRLDLPSRMLLAAGSLGFAFEIYADFSGYTDLSRGFAGLLGFETSQNFNQPYLAISLQDFWQRWHMSLSRWLRDFVFFPLRRALLKITGWRRGLADWAAPLVTMLVSGLWHGWGWTFMAWGFYHGLLLVLDQKVQRFRKRELNPYQMCFQRGVTFMSVLVGWSIFRAPSLGWLMQIWMKGSWGLDGSQGIALMAVMSLIMMYTLPLGLYALVKASGKARVVLEPAFFALALTLLVIFAASGMRDFVYMDF